MTEKLCKMTCPVCKAEWADESLMPSASRAALRKEMKVAAPCGHGEAFLLRFYDISYNVWYYEQIDFIISETK